MHSSTQLGTLLGVKMTTAFVGGGICPTYNKFCASLCQSVRAPAWFRLFFRYLYNQTVVIIRLSPVSPQFGKHPHPAWPSM